MIKLFIQLTLQNIHEYSMLNFSLFINLYVFIFTILEVCFLVQRQTVFINKVTRHLMEMIGPKICRVHDP
jgi:hypothetical protein